MGTDGNGFYWAACCAALAVVIVILLRRSSRYFGRRQRDEAHLVRTPRGKQTARAGARDPEAERMRQEVHLHETARELSARLDNKISVLEYLTGTAQQQIDRLESLINKAERIGRGGQNATGGATREKDNNRSSNG